MRISRRFIAGVVACGAIAAIPSSAVADDCNGEVTEAAGFYIDNRDVGDLWIYQESNGEAGLQSGGAGAVSEDDCGSSENPDTLIF